MKHNWEYRRLGDVCFTKKEIGRASTYYGADDEISYFDISSIDNSVNRVTSYSTTTFGDAPSRAQQVIENGDVLFSLVRPNLKNIALLNSDAANKVGTSGFCVLRGKNVLPKYVLHFVISSQFTEYILSKASGASYPAVTEDDVRKASIPVPTMEMQKRIVAELDKINELIEAKREQLKHLDSLAQSIFYDTFGDPITNPKGWPTKKFSSLSELSAGGDKPLDAVKFQSDDKSIPIYFYSNGVDNEGLYGYTSEPRITRPAITISGRGTLGVPFIRRHPFVPIIRLIVAIPNKEINLTFLYWIIRQSNLKGKGAAIPQLTVPMIKDKLIIVPPLAMQEQFAAKVEAIEAQKATVEKSIAELQTLLDSRMDYWFN